MQQIRYFPLAPVSRFVALAAVGRIKLLTRDVFAAMPFVKLDNLADGVLRSGDELWLLWLDVLLWLEFETALRNDGLDGGPDVWFSLKLVFRATDELIPLVGVALLVCDRRTVGPMLEPLELLLDAGVRAVVVADDDLGADTFTDDIELDALCRVNGFLYNVLSAEVDGVRCAFNGTFRTVFIDVALFRDDRELRKLVRELLRSTSLLLCALVWSADFLNELVLRGMTLRLVGAGADVLNERLRSRLCRLRSSKVCTVDLGIARRFAGESLLAAVVALSDELTLSIFVFFIVLLSG